MSLTLAPDRLLTAAAHGRKLPLLILGSAGGRTFDLPETTTEDFDEVAQERLLICDRRRPTHGETRCVIATQAALSNEASLENVASSPCPARSAGGLLFQELPS